MTNDKYYDAPAFPQAHPMMNGKGLTMLDYFAAQAMQGLLSMSPDYMGQYYPNFKDKEPNGAELATHSYNIAVALLEARKNYIK